MMYENLNPGIRKTVKLLNDHGWDTCDSGDGKTREFECDRERGYVVVLLKEEHELEQSAHEIVQLLWEHGVDFNVEEDPPSIQASFNPVDGYRLVDIDGVNDSMLKENSNTL